MCIGGSEPSVESRGVFVNIFSVSKLFFRRTGAAEPNIKVPAYAGVRVFILLAQTVLCAGGNCVKQISRKRKFELFSLLKNALFTILQNFLQSR